jgi:hypothetical protein
MINRYSVRLRRGSTSTYCLGTSYSTCRPGWNILQVRKACSNLPDHIRRCRCIGLIRWSQPGYNSPEGKRGMPPESCLQWLGCRMQAHRACIHPSQPHPCSCPWGKGGSPTKRTRCSIQDCICNLKSEDWLGIVSWRAAGKQKVIGQKVNCQEMVNLMVMNSSSQELRFLADLSAGNTRVDGCPPCRIGVLAKVTEQTF